MSYAEGSSSVYAPTLGSGQELGEKGERGYRRRKLAAMAGNLYRSGQQAVSEMRENYAQAWSRGTDDETAENTTSIPGAFPDVAIASQGNEQMVLFPSYAKRHVERRGDRELTFRRPEEALQDGESWRHEWERTDGQEAIVDVDVRGWVYAPRSGPMTRRNRILLGLARQLSGNPAPKANDRMQDATTEGSSANHLSIREEAREEAKIKHEAAMIEKLGKEEERVAHRGGYSERPPEKASVDAEVMRTYPAGRRRGQTPLSVPSSPILAARHRAHELSGPELAVANVNLMARIAPFMTNPLVAMPLTIFFYNERQSKSRTVLTNDAGHFVVRAPLDFVPTHVRVLANEELSATQEINITEPLGVSLISDVDDTIKHSNISAGAREILRNTFVRDLEELTVEGVREWYNRMHSLGVSLHYCSNSPWQLFPVLASFFKVGGLPPGSFHLKQYSGMLQGIFEPVAERKKTTLNRLLSDFPERNFILVGDSGEADLEVYTDLALAHPGRVVAVFVRDVTTPEQIGYFDSSFHLGRRKAASAPAQDETAVAEDAIHRPTPRSVSRVIGDALQPVEPGMGTLIDFDLKNDESKNKRPDQMLNLVKVSNSTESLPKRNAPPRPVKPEGLRSLSWRDQSSRPMESASSGNHAAPGTIEESRNLRPIVEKKFSAGGQSNQPPELPPRNVSSCNLSSGFSRLNIGKPSESPPRPLPQRRPALHPSSYDPRPAPPRRTPSSNSDVDYKPLPPAAELLPTPGARHYRAGTRSGDTTPGGSPTLGAQSVNKKLELWRRRLARAYEQLDSHGVALYTWRKGQDVMAEAEAIVKSTLQEMERDRRYKPPK